ncbi:GNAT family N-acetyltransferase [Sandaracinobacter sp. RS1-74]|uniref:GNAT family N-acetyltransferase n=1 Tax=Sandaracinobacteroides sayramensis TaxID=2913411 RepID=UPI001EDB435E|nr:GNAT family N-acetyltransferase [Sandaracinobacteroides sayramensis]MCG2842438.1 GNAT family N-acetyltransferase [Sandaracinobacteroides sayramensis]
MMILRDALPRDSDALGELHVHSWIESYTGLIDPQILSGLSVPDRSASWRRMIETPQPRSRILLLEREGALLGFGAAGAQRNRSLASQGYDGEIAAIYLLKAAQGTGDGRRLFTALAQSLAEQGFRAHALWVLTENRPARGFYERLGGRLLSLSRPLPHLGGPEEVAYGWRDLRPLPANPDNPNCTNRKGTG